MNIRSEAEYRGIVFSDEIWDGRLLQRTVFEACVFERCQFEALDNGNICRFEQCQPFRIAAAERQAKAVRGFTK